MKTVVVAIYIDPDYFPPTINAILNFAATFDQVIVISRNNAIKDFPFPENVELKKVGPYSTVRQMEKQPFYKKLFYFLSFAVTLYKQASSTKCALVVLYDSFALYAFIQFRKLLKGKRIWYHSHDMVDRNQLNKRSIGGHAAAAEDRGLKYVDFFSLPSKERLRYFPGLPKEVTTFILPNYPSLMVYHHKKDLSLKNKEICIIYQGFIGPGHGLEELVQLLPSRIRGSRLRLLLKGSVTENYRSKLNLLAYNNGCSGQLQWIAISAYKEVQIQTRQADIGVGINSNIDAVSLTQGTASNKIYEYAACSLPVILFNSRQFKEQLGQYSWTFFTDGSMGSIQQCIISILENHEHYAAAARQDFETHLNFESVFIPVLKQVTNSLLV